MKIFINVRPIGLQSFRTAGSCVTVAGGLAARQNHVDRSQNDERTAVVGRPSAAMGSGREMVGSRAVEANETGCTRIHPDQARDRGQVPIVSHNRPMARRPQAGTTRRRIRGVGDRGVLMPWLPATSPTRPPVAASFSRWDRFANRSPSPIGVARCGRTTQRGADSENLAHRP